MRRERARNRAIWSSHSPTAVCSLMPPGFVPMLISDAERNRREAGPRSTRPTITPRLRRKPSLRVAFGEDRRRSGAHLALVEWAIGAHDSGVACEARGEVAVREHALFSLKRVLAGRPPASRFRRRRRCHRKPCRSPQLPAWRPCPCPWPCSPAGQEAAASPPSPGSAPHARHGSLGSRSPRP